MRFNLPEQAVSMEFTSTVQIGNIYACKGGNKTKFWIVIGISERTVNLLGVNAAGEITSTANYGVHVFESGLFPERRVLGFCAGLDQLEFDVTWNQPL